MGRDVNMPALPLHHRSIEVSLKHWDIFCRVIDNYGDIGVCWRLALQLTVAQKQSVRLWVDDLDSLVPLCPACDPALAVQVHAGITIFRWPIDAAPAVSNLAVDWSAMAKTAAVVIESFACELPAPYLQAMAGGEFESVKPPVWINLEYLTAEPWAESCHRVASPHPTLPLIKYFFFPGFSASTGGLLRESRLPAPVCPPSPDISLFCYDNAPIAAWLDALAQMPEPIRCRVFPGKPLAAVQAQLGDSGPWQLGQARIEPVPFVPQADYDALLRDCALNIVRGEDSFVRAQLAGRPFIWHIYPQDDNAHMDKLNAFLDRYTEGLPTQLATTIRRMFVAWNEAQSPEQFASAWADFYAALPQIAQHALVWRDYCQQLPELSASLVKFCAETV